MTRTQWIIIAALAVGVVLELCLVGFFVITRAPALLQQNQAAALVPAEATAAPSATDAPVPTLTYQASATPTLVMNGEGGIGLASRPPTPTGFVGVVLPTVDLSFLTPAPPRPQSTRVPGPISDAFDKVAKAKVMRFDIQMSMQGNFGDIPGFSAGGGNGHMTLIGMSGETNGKDSHMVMKGFLSAMFGGDPNQGLEMMTVGGKSYIRGPAPMFGAPEAKWYASDKSTSANLSTSQADPTDMINSFSGSYPDWSKFKKTGTDKLDNQTCDVYTGDRDAALKLFESLDTKQQIPTNGDLSALDTVEARIWICSDGYFHQLKMTLSGKSLNKPGETMGMDVLFHIYDVNGKITITAPKDPSPLQAPDWFKFATPTPKK